MRISDWSSDVCSSDLGGGAKDIRRSDSLPEIRTGPEIPAKPGCKGSRFRRPLQCRQKFAPERSYGTEWIGAHIEHAGAYARVEFLRRWRSEEHTSELQSLMRISYAVICLKKKKKQTKKQ